MPDDEVTLPSGEARKLASFAIEFAGRLAIPAGPEGYAARHKEELARQTLALVEFRPLWWQILRLPRAAWELRRMRRQLLGRGQLGEVRTWLCVNRLVSRLRFGEELDPLLAAHLERYVRAGCLTPRDAWRLIRSLGCRVKGGSPEPAPVSRATAFTGAAFGAIAFALSGLFLWGAAASWFGPCRDICGFVGFLLMALAAAAVAPLLVCATWGRRDAGVFLQRILSSEPRELPDSERRPLVARLCW